MKLPGITRMLSMLGGFVLAIPMAIIGFEFLTQGRTAFGIAFLILAIALLFLPEYIVSQIPGPRTVIKNKLSRFRRD